MKKAMGILAVALFSMGLVSFSSSDNSTDQTKNQYQNIGSASFTDGAVTPTSGRK